MFQAIGRWLARAWIADQVERAERLSRLRVAAADECDDLRAQLADTEKVCGELRETRNKALVALREAAVELDDARTALEAARGDAEMRTRAHGEALATANTGRTEALARLKSIETLAREGREFLE